ncbi:hypothetical protein COV17_01520 [Candidatus Woesearchaeota archaeon CG10_big_fil_rev_8_21_14_0_10_36_11]|nr:MAG: hypothetical protein COV17_01520 [Candidatus Woesearchaeota archaeon CG10_big_fil_rev_8_21_14_0_10_36_11]
MADYDLRKEGDGVPTTESGAVDWNTALDDVLSGSVPDPNDHYVGVKTAVLITEDDPSQLNAAYSAVARAFGANPQGLLPEADVDSYDPTVGNALPEGVRIYASASVEVTESHLDKLYTHSPDTTIISLLDRDMAGNESNGDINRDDSGDTRPGELLLYNPNFAHYLKKGSLLVIHTGHGADVRELDVLFGREKDNPLAGASTHIGSFLERHPNSAVVVSDKGSGTDVEGSAVESTLDTVVRLFPAVAEHPEIMIPAIRESAQVNDYNWRRVIDSLLE